MEKIKEIIEMLSELIEDTSIPKNIRKALSDSKQRLTDKDAELNVKVSASIYSIESITDDINMPAHARTQIWAIISELESLKTNNR
ncbi:MAG TPA: UPF0147 family protein [Candidatus Bilamarchaeaceae archaeon]|nr:UPF0147 family protein [Candidatus Bilamarchaeaceae archaeon]